MAGKASASKKASEARQAAAELRAKQRAAARRTTILSALGAVALIALFAVAIFFIIKSSEGDEVESGPYTVYDSGELTIPNMAEDDGSILVGPGGVIGEEPEEGAIHVNLYEDPLCPYCSVFIELVGGDLESYIDQGEVALRFHVLPILDGYSAGSQYSTRMASAWVTVAEYDPDHFWTFVKTSLANQPPEGEVGLTNEEIADLARLAGVSEDAIAKFADGEFTTWVTETKDASGVRATPTILVDGVPFAMSWVLFPGSVAFGIEYVMENGTEAFVDWQVDWNSFIQEFLTEDGYVTETFIALHEYADEYVKENGAEAFGDWFEFAQGYVEDNGAQAFADYLAGLMEPAA